MPEKFIRLRIDGELKMAIRESRTDPIVEAADDVVDVADLHDAPQLAPRHQPQRHRRNHTEEAVASDSQTESIDVLFTAAANGTPFGVDQCERIDVRDKRLH